MRAFKGGSALLVLFAIACAESPESPTIPQFSHIPGLPPGAPHLTLVKLTNGVDAKTPPGPILSVGDPVVWTYVVTNDGGSDFSLVEISDDQEGFICRLERSGPGGPILPVGETATCVKTGVVQPGQYRNEGTATGTSVNGRPSVNKDVSHYLANSPPVCAGATPSVSEIWPPNHKFVPVDVGGVFDPDGDEVAVTVTWIFQDEPTDTNGDGAFAPDGRGVGTSTAEVRAERAGSGEVPGDGRVYHIGFTASDAFGSSCQGEVLVVVPHDRRGAGAVDGGALYDSTH